MKLDEWVMGVAWSPDGEYIAASTYAGSLYLLDKNGNTLWIRNLGKWIRGLAWSPDGLKIAAGTKAGSLYKLLASSILVVNTQIPAMLLVKSEGKVLASYNINPGNTTLYLPPGTYELEAQLEEPPGMIGPKIKPKTTSKITLELGNQYTVTIPGYDELLAKLRAEAKPGATIIVSWDSGEWQLSIPEEGEIEAWIAPGTYRVVLKWSNPFLKPPLIERYI